MKGTKIEAMLDGNEQGSLESQAKDYGIDINLIHCLMRLTPEERFLRHQRALHFVRELQKAGKIIRGRLFSNHKNT